jgi:2-oxoisovalerate dehydrogenase E1 component
MNPRPILIEGLTFRMRGHEEASGTKYVPQELLETWAEKDPILHFEKYLFSLGILGAEDPARIRNEIKQEVDRAVEQAYMVPEITPDIEKELAEVYAPLNSSDRREEIPSPIKQDMPIFIAPELRFLDSIRQGIIQAMEKYPKMIFMGQDIAEYGGAFKLSEGLLELFGKDRVRNTPLCESGIIGVGLGLSIKGYKSLIEMQFADFVTMGFNQIVNNLAKIHYRWGQNADIVIRMPTGAGTAAGPFHSQSNEAWFTKTPGLKVVYPAFPFDAKGLLLSSIEDPNPVLFFEHKYLYRSLSGPVPEEYFTLPIGKGHILVEGNDLSLITYGLGVHWALECLKENPEIKAELIDLRSLQPWDKELVLSSVRKTGKALILHEDTLTGGFGGEIAAYIAEHAFQNLDGPILRCASLDTPIPSSALLEEEFLAKKRLKETLIYLYKY